MLSPGLGLQRIVLVPQFIELHEAAQEAGSVDGFFRNRDRTLTGNFYYWRPGRRIQINCLGDDSPARPPLAAFAEAESAG
jgi:hypothetical protein